METSGVIQELGMYAGSFLVCLVSGLVPIVNAEIFLIGLVALTSPTHPEIAMVVLAGTLGQMAAKTSMYWGARGIFKFNMTKYEAKVAQWRDRFARSEPGLSFFIFISAFTGLPPFFVTSILAGVFKIPFVRFLLVGSAGRYVRFGLVAWSPTVWKQIF